MLESKTPSRDVVEASADELKVGRGGARHEFDRDFVQSLASGLDVIRVFGPEHSRLSLSEVAGLTGQTRTKSRTKAAAFRRTIGLLPA